MDSLMFDYEIGPMVMAVLGAVFGSYGLRELVLAWWIEPFDEWFAKAVPAGGGVLLGTLFVCVGLRAF
jgi:hypothetical protein